MMTDAQRHTELLAAAAKTYRFPDPSRADLTTPVPYLRALIAHVHRVNATAAHELRIGKARADWTPAEVEGFHRLLNGVDRLQQALETAALKPGN